jgi:hypothetical protein
MLTTWWHRLSVLTSPTIGDHSVGIVRPRTQATEFSFVLIFMWNFVTKLIVNRIYLDECSHLIGYSAVHSICKPTFRRNVSPPSSGLKSAEHEVSVQQVAIHNSTRCSVSEDGNIDNYRCDNLKSIRMSPSRSVPPTELYAVHLPDSNQTTGSSRTESMTWCITHSHVGISCMTKEVILR